MMIVEEPAQGLGSGSGKLLIRDRRIVYCLCSQTLRSFNYGIAALLQHLFLLIVFFFGHTSLALH